MRVGALLIPAIIIVVLVIGNDARQRSRQKHKQEIRKYVISCCGKTKCSEIFQKTKTLKTTNQSLPSIAERPTSISSKTSLLRIQPTVASEQIISSARPITAVLETAATANEDKDEVDMPTLDANLPVTIQQDGAEGATTEKNTQSTPDKTSAKATDTSSPDTSTAFSSSTAATPTSSSNMTSTMTNSLLTESSSTSKTTTTTSTSTTTSTTPKPRCPLPSCETFKGGLLKNAQTIPSGSFKFIDGIYYFFNAEPIFSLLDAASACSRMNMSLPVIENTEALSTLNSIITSTTARSVWTSGSSDGDSCDIERSFIWCSTGSKINDSVLKNANFWANSEIPGYKPMPQKCLALKFPSAVGNVGLAQSDCGELNSLLCLPSCTTGSCLSQCTKDATLFENGLLKKPERFGIWADACGKTVLFGNKIMNWNQNAQNCCSLGMEPIFFSSVEQQQCISNLTSTNWKGNINYWTGGTQTCKGLWGWCAGAFINAFTSNLHWAQNQPEMLKSGENCLQMRINSNDSGVLLSGRACKNKYVYACQGIATTPAPCLKPSCPQFCATNESLFVSNNLHRAFTYGEWFNSCGRKLHYPYLNATWQEAWNFCCSLNMKLVSIESTSKHACLTKLAKKYKKSGVELWTSASDLNCDGKYLWCAKNRELDHTLNWQTGQPSSASGDCVFATFSNVSVNASTFSLGNCAEKRSFVCEVYKTSATEADMLQQECMEIYDITSDEMKAFKQLNFNATGLILKLKCFIKCVGEAAGLLFGGDLFLTINALRIIEETSTSHDALQANFDSADECGNKGNADECEKAAEIYQCTREKAPEVVNTIQLALTDNSSVFVGSKAYPCIPSELRTCRLKGLPCNVDAALQQGLLNTGFTSNGTTITTTSGKKYFVSTVLNNRTPFMCYQYCCSIGMRLAEFYSQAEYIDVMQQSPTNKYGFIGEVYVNGRFQDVWCDSDAVITDMKLYSNLMPSAECNVNSCYKAFSNYTHIHIDASSCAANQKFGLESFFVCM